ncbi:hypothetical protein F2Q69_00016272 [Brassica cretica]|uniref:Uncharacterized protein n=1 Tax=Brassica cretica TaxID=69181 RepID=A0A8S9R9F3_BRACR|nr:hypothetical protein F2Q69_00016272 [Brassica cretica]
MDRCKSWASLFRMRGTWILRVVRQGHALSLAEEKSVGSSREDSSPNRRNQSFARSLVRSQCSGSHGSSHSLNSSQR